MRCFLACYSMLALALAACGPSVGGGADDDDDGAGDGDGDGPDPSTDGGGTPSTQECRKMDLVFVVDDSGSMAEEQTNLASNFPMFANVLNGYMTGGGELLDYRAAVTTTGVTAQLTLFPLPLPVNQTGQDGRFLQKCGMTRRWLERTDSMMATTFACAANVGTTGPGIEMQLRAAELAIQPQTNPGFLRDDALLGIVILTDEDDCSFRQTSGITITSPTSCTSAPGIPAVTEFLTAIDQVKGERGRWAAAIIAGQTSCTSSFGDAVEGVRLKQFAQAAGDNVVFGDICAGNLSGALQQALDTFQAACENFPPIP